MSIHDKLQIQRYALQGMKAERARLDAEIKELEANLNGTTVESQPAPFGAKASRRVKISFSPERREKMRKAMVRRWREAKKSGAGSLVAAKKSTAKKKAAPKRAVKKVTRKAAKKATAATGATE